MSRPGALRVLFVDHAQALGGAERSLLLLLKHLDCDRFEPILACNEGALAQAARELGTTVEVVDMPRLRRAAGAPLRLARGVRSLCRLIERQGIEVVHSNVVRASIYAALAARLTGRPLVWHVRDVFRSGPYVWAMSHMATRAIAISKVTADQMPRRVPVDCIPNGVDLGALDASLLGGENLRTEWGVLPGAPLIGLVGRLQPWKGQTDFVRSMALVAEAHPAARFVLVGGAIFGGGEAYEASLLDLVERLGLEAQVIFAGQREDLGSVLSTLDLLVHCSIAPELFGRVIIEGLAARLPIVAYAHGGPAEIISDGVTGLLVPPGDRGALAGQVLKLLGDASLCQRLGVAGRELVERDYQAQTVARRTEEVLMRARPYRGRRR